MNSIQQAAESPLNFKDESIAAIAAQYGETYAKAVDEIIGALLMSSGIVAVGGNDVISRLLLTDLAAKLTARVVTLVERAYALSRDQMREVMDLSKELHKKLMDTVPPGAAS